MRDNIQIRVVLADDHVIVRQSIRKLLEESNILVVGEASDGLEAFKLVETMQPDILICDINMGAMNGLEVTRRVAKQFQQIKIIILSMFRDDSYVIEALRAGAIAYLLKSSSSTELLQAIQNAIDGKHHLSASLSERAIGSYIQKATASKPEPFDTLTIREREVMQMVVEGKTSAEIGKKLFISPRTVDIHRANLIRKLGLRTRIDLVQIAQQQGILPSEFQTKKMNATVR
ncbi:MAG: response regulator transcription factor [Dehalococcoidales bacterium]